MIQRYAVNRIDLCENCCNLDIIIPREDGAFIRVDDIEPILKIIMRYEYTDPEWLDAEETLNELIYS